MIIFFNVCTIVVCPHTSSKLFGLYSKVERANFDDSIDSITILNNNIVNQMLIYEIVN